MKQGIMPGSEVQFTDKAGDIIEKLGEPGDQSGYEGSMFFVYENFSYAIPFDWKAEDDIILIIKQLFEAYTAKQLIEAWGEPTEQGELTELDPGVFSYSYLFDSHVINFMAEGGLDGKVNSVVMQQLKK